MSEEIKIHRKRVKEVEAIICDRCKKRVDGEDGFELQEMLRWSMRGGYSSVFGDGDEMTLDLCQNCVKEVLGDFIQHHGNAYFD